MPRDAGAVFLDLAKLLNRNEQKGEKNKLIRKYRVVLRCIPGKLKATEPSPGQPFQSSQWLMQTEAHQTLSLEPAHALIVPKVSSTIPFMSL